MTFYERIKTRIENEDFRAVFTNALWLFADKIIRQGLNFLLTAYIARYLGVELFGLWNYAIAFVVLFSFFSTLGIYNQLLRDFVKFPEKRNELLGGAFLIKLSGGFVTLALSFATISFIKEDQPLLHTLIAVIALGYVFQSLDVIDYFFQSQLKSRWIAISRMVSFLMFATLKLFFIYQKLPLIYFVWAQAGELLVSELILIIVYSRHYGSVLQWKINWRSSGLMLKESLPILFAEVAILIYMRVDQVMIGEMIGNNALGIFSAAVRLSELWYLVPGVICSSTFPSIIRSYTDDPLSYQRKLQHLYDILVWLSIGIALLVSLLSPYIVYLIYGSKFIEASSILIIHIWTSVFVFVGFASNQQLVLEKLTKISFYRTLYGVVANIALNFLLIPVWGAQGAAVATLIAQAFSSWLSNYFYKETRGIFWMNLRTLNPRRLIR